MYNCLEKFGIELSLGQQYTTIYLDQQMYNNEM